MTIQELKEKKRNLEKEIVNRLRDFQKETGMDTSINIECSRKIENGICLEIEEINISITSIIAQSI